MPPQGYRLEQVGEDLALHLLEGVGAGRQTILIRRVRNQAMFICECGRSVRTLFRPWGEIFFKCRTCWNLTYLKCQRRSRKPREPLLMPVPPPRNRRLFPRLKPAAEDADKFP